MKSAKTKKRTMGDIADEHWKLEVLRDELAARDKLLKEKQGALEAEAIALAATIDDTAAKVYYGKNSVGSIKTREHPKVADAPKLHAWMKKTGRFEILENRISTTAFFALREDGVQVPGTTIFKHDVFTTKRRKGG